MKMFDKITHLIPAVYLAGMQRLYQMRESEKVVYVRLISILILLRLSRRFRKTFEFPLVFYPYNNKEIFLDVRECFKVFNKKIMFLLFCSQCSVMGADLVYLSHGYKSNTITYRSHFLSVCDAVAFTTACPQLPILLCTNDNSSFACRRKEERKRKERKRGGGKVRYVCREGIRSQGEEISEKRMIENNDIRQYPYSQW